MAQVSTVCRTSFQVPDGVEIKGTPDRRGIGRRPVTSE